MLIDADQPLGFNHFARELPISRATVARVLRVLQLRGWIRKNPSTGKYYPGAPLGGKESGPGVADVLRASSRHILKSLTEQTGNTSLVVYWDRRRMICVDKEVRVESVVMQNVGAIFSDLSHAPWGWIIYGELNPEEKAHARKEFEYSEFLDARLEEEMKSFRKNGFVYDDQNIYSSLRRLGAPIRDGNGEIIGGIGIGGTPFSMKSEQVYQYGRALVEHADRLSWLMGRNPPEETPSSDGVRERQKER
jgi:DNA-binding IclR family transcriptional regulator